jgi:hypothetical protein
MIQSEPQPRPRPARVEFLIAGFALLALLIGEASMNATIRGTQFAAVDGRMAEAVIRAAFKLAAPFNVTNLNHIQGFGSLLLPFNVWANPAYWPFAFIDGDRAAEVSGLVALASFVIAVYAMARSFDLPPLPSALAAQSCIVLFGPLVMLASGTTVFVLEPGFAVVYAPLMAALGTLARIGPGRVVSFILRTSLLLLLLLYSIYGDPLWGLIGGISWSAAFAVVVLSPLRRKPILVRCAALACCVVVLAASGVLEYLYTLPRYTARVQFSSLLMRPADVTYGSVLFTSDYAKYAYGSCILGWMFGLVAVSGRPRVLVVAGAASFVFLLAYATAFLVLQPDWWLPLPIYVEQCIWPLFATAGVAGYWGALRHLGLFARHLAAGGDLRRRLALAGRWPGVPVVAALAAVTVVPAAGILAADRNRQLATAWALPQPNETELVDFLSTQIGLRVGKPFRGSAMFSAPDYFDILSISNLWQHGIPTANEYSQLITPQIFYLNSSLFKKDVSGDINHFVPWIGSGATFETFFKALPALGVRYLVAYSLFPQADQQLMPARTFPRRQPRGPYYAWQERKWEVYEFPYPNVGDYSPTHVVTSDSAAAIVAHLSGPDFDFRRDVVLGEASQPLVPAREPRLSITRGGLHFSAESDGTSLVLLPQQFYNCLKASDPTVRIVRANLTSAAVLFSGKVDTDISLGYGMLSPACRRADLADVNRLSMVLPGRPNRIEHGWDGTMKRLGAAVTAISVFHGTPSWRSD